MLVAQRIVQHQNNVRRDERADDDQYASQHKRAESRICRRRCLIGEVLICWFFGRTFWFFVSQGGGPKRDVPMFRLCSNDSF